ncbi:hypothetical protein [Klebsiella variicola]|uniref:hypothetical protein n=1 Tax=Klebsiella variicola TaxID=244366 RepID=UPI000E2ACB6E|nr:hypothetical protein [Klebsiella variicola]SXF67309.1 transcriptional regulator [Klebsiella variicola]
MIPAMNMEAQHRKKDPVRLHRQLLESAAMIAGRDGIAALSLAMPDEPVLRKCWRDWMLDHLAQGDALDNGPTGTLVRYAADGIWLSELTEGRTMSNEHRQSLVNDLTKMTLPA